MQLHFCPTKRRDNFPLRGTAAAALSTQRPKPLQVKAWQRSAARKLTTASRGRKILCSAIRNSAFIQPVRIFGLRRNSPGSSPGGGSCLEAARGGSVAEPHILESFPRTLGSRSSTSVILEADADGLPSQASPRSQRLEARELGKHSHGLHTPHTNPSHPLSWRFGQGFEWNNWAPRVGLSECTHNLLQECQETYTQPGSNWRPSAC